MERIYTDLKNEASFGGVEKLFQSLKKSGKSRKEVSKWLQSFDPYTLYKPVQRKFIRNRYFVWGPFDIFQIDLVFLRDLAEYNDGVQFLLTCIDCFTKKVAVQTLKTKNSREVTEAMKRILESYEEKPRHIHSDKGSEFLNSIFGNYMKEMGIHHYVT